MYNRGRRGHDHMVVWFTTSYAISAYHHWCFELESRSELLVKSKLPSLKIRRIRTIAIETFKIINKETPQYLHDLVTLKNNKYNFRYSNTAHIPTVKTTRYGLNSFRYYASKTCNELPDHFRKETSFNQFKSLINSWNGSSCHCSFCAWF